jgi:hypothetical protein
VLTHTEDTMAPAAAASKVVRRVSRVALVEPVKAERLADAAI